MSEGLVACAAEIVTSSVVAGAVQMYMCVAAGISPLCAASGHVTAVNPAVGSAGAISPADAWIQLLAVPENAGTSISYIPPASNDVTAAPSCVTIITTYTRSCALRGLLGPPHHGRHVQHIASTLPAHCRRHVHTHAKRMWQAGAKKQKWRPTAASSSGAPWPAKPVEGISHPIRRSS